MKPTGIVMATRWEAAPVIRHFGLRKIKSNLWKGVWKSQELLLAVSGVGAEPARKASYRLCGERAGGLVSAGFCGALVPELKVGDIVSYRLATSAVPLRTVQERQTLAERANAVAVDMETQAVIEAGTRCGVPIRVCRVISDSMTDDLTPLFGADLAFSGWKIALRLLNPSVWPLANRLRVNSKIAQTQLLPALEEILSTPWIPT